MPDYSRAFSLFRLWLCPACIGRRLCLLLIGWLLVFSLVRMIRPEPAFLVGMLRLLFICRLLAHDTATMARLNSVSRHRMFLFGQTGRLFAAGIFLSNHLSLPGPDLMNTRMLRGIALLVTGLCIALMGSILVRIPGPRMIIVVPRLEQLDSAQVTAPEQSVPGAIAYAPVFLVALAGI